jgi:hypothetical protein
MGAFVGKTKNENGKGVMVDYVYFDGAKFQPSDEDVKKCARGLIVARPQAARLRVASPSPARAERFGRPRAAAPHEYSVPKDP